MLECSKAFLVCPGANVIQDASHRPNIWVKLMCRSAAVLNPIISRNCSERHKASLSAGQAYTSAHARSPTGIAGACTAWQAAKAIGCMKTVRNAGKLVFREWPQKAPSSCSLLHSLHSDWTTGMAGCGDLAKKGNP